MKKLNQLLIVEIDSSLGSLLTRNKSFLESFSELPPEEKSAEEIINGGIFVTQQLVLFHTNLSTPAHLQQARNLCIRFPYSTVIIVSKEQEESHCIQAIEAGAEDCVIQRKFTREYMHKAVVLSLRRNRAYAAISQSRKQLEKEKELSDSIINGLPGLFYLFTKQNRYLRWNKEQEIVSGYNADEISKMSPLDFFDEEEKQYVQASIDEVFEKGKAAVEANFFTKDGRKIPYYFTGVAVTYEATECLLGMGIDLSSKKRLERELSRQKNATQKKLMQAMIDAEEKEKAKLGLELHDNISQILSVVRMYMAILDSNDVPDGVSLSRTIQLLDAAINEIRNLSHSLAISYKFEVGITEALKEMIDKISLTRGFSIDLSIHTALNERTNSDQKLAIYRIVQEQMNNITKYAQASEVTLHIDVTIDEIYLKIGDNGKGFNPLKVEKGLGLNNIISRTEALEGKVTIESSPGKGCQVIVKLPTQIKKELAII